MIKKIYLLALFCSLTAASSHADLTPDGMTLGIGSSVHIDDQKADFTAYRASLLWDWDEPLVTFTNWQLTGYYDLSVNYWKSNLTSSDDRSVGASKVEAVSFTPVFRLESIEKSALNFFFDAGVGLSYLSEEDIQQEKRQSTINMGGHGQFEIRAMLGAQFGSRHQYEVAYGWYHYSNAGIHGTNEGIDFQLVHFGWRF